MSPAGGTHEGDHHHHGHSDAGGAGAGGRWTRWRHRLRPHSHDHAEMLTADQASTQGVRAAWVGLAGMGATALLQLVIVAISGSVALLADTLHNLGHLATTIPLIIAFRLGRRRPTPTYPYGFRRAEDLVGLLIAVVIAVSAVLVVVESVDAFLDPRPVSNLGWVLAAGLVGAAGNEAVAVYRIRAGRRIGSMALVAEGQHARTDGLTSLAVVLGVIGVWAGFPQADALVGFAIAVVIIAVLVATVRVTVRRLMDGVEPDVLATIAAVAADVPGVVAVGRVRARWTGHRLEAEVDISVDGSSTVSHGHSVAEAVHHDILHRVPGAHHVAVHVNPEGDAHAHGLTQHHSST